MKKYDVTALGELLIDFTENGKSSQGNPLFEANPGGAPCNVLAMLAKLGHDTAFIGKVGNDFFGEQLRAAIKEVGIDELFEKTEILSFHVPLTDETHYMCDNYFINKFKKDLGKRKWNFANFAETF